MLTRHVLRTAVALAVTTLTIALGIAVATPALADNNCWTDANGHTVCGVQAGGGGTDPAGDTGGGTSSGPGKFTPGPTSCTSTPQGGTPAPVPCTKDGAWWSNSGQCYWSLDNPQEPTPPGQDPTSGAWYTCTPLPPDCGAPSSLCGIQYTVAQWLTEPPAGINKYTPAQAAGMLVKTFTLNPIRIGMAPAKKTHTDDPAGTAPYRRTWVGIPVWLWVNDPTTSTWGPISKTATYGGQTVTATATVQSLTWSSGDGQTITCGAGTAFNEAYWANRPAEDSPTCGFRYQHTSGSGTFTVTAQSVWVVKWTGSGQSGTIQMPTTTSTAHVRVGELQSVNTNDPGDTFYAGQ